MSLHFLLISQTKAAYNVTFEQVGRYFQSGYSFTSVEISSNYLFTGSGNGWYVLDVTDPSAPAVVYDGSADANIMGLRIQDNELFVLRNQDFKVYDISNPITPAFKGKSSTSSDAGVYAVPARFGAILAPNIKYGLSYYQYDESRQAYISMARRLTSINATYIAPAKDVLVVASYGANFGYGLYTFGPGSGVSLLEVLGQAPGSDLLSVCVADKFVVAACGTSGLRFYDLSDVRAPVLYATIGLGPNFIRNVDVDGPIAYAAYDSRGVAAIDFSAPNQPRLCGSFNTKGTGWDVCARGGYVYVADETNGVLALKPTLTFGNAPQFAPQATNVVLHSHENLTLKGPVAGDLPMNIKWYRGDTLLQTNRDLEITNAMPINDGLYRCTASNTFGIVTNQIFVRVLGTPILLADGIPDAIHLQIRDGQEKYPVTNLKYIELQSSTNLTTWKIRFKALANDSLNLGFNRTNPPTFYRLIEHEDPL
jgi:hypothetical protein